jgi:hypothetical protein
MNALRTPSPRLLALACAAACGLAHAQSDETSLNFSGFATAGVVRTTESRAVFGVPGQADDGATRSASFTPDTKLGLQLSGKLNSMFSATGQVITKYTGDGNWTPTVEWAFVKAQLTPQVGVRVGRIGLPIFSVSDFRDVNYANVWMRPPLDVYGQVPVSHADGADISWQFQLAGATVNTQLFGGKSSAVYTGNKLDLKDIYGLNATVELDGGWTLRLGHVESKLTVHNAALNGLLTVVNGAGFTSVAQQLDPTNKPASFSGLGLGYDQGNWVASAEYTRRKNQSYVSDTTGWYTSVGYRIGNFTPYAVISAIKVDDSNVVNTIPKGVAPALTGLSMAVDGAVATQALGQKSAALGLRWDAYRNTALKFQMEHIKIDGGRGLFGYPQTGFGDGASVNVYGLSVDHVF